MSNSPVRNDERDVGSDNSIDENDNDANRKSFAGAPPEVPQILETFDILKKVGSGTFSSVHLARLKERGADKTFAIKFIVPTTHPSRTAMELSCLINFGGHDNILPAYSCVRHFDEVAIVMPYFPHDEFKSYVNDLSADELRLYVKSLLTALDRVHRTDVIHRDVKPSNFLFHRKNKKFALIDFGLAQKVSDVAQPRQKEKRKSTVVEPKGAEPPLQDSARSTGDPKVGNNENITPKVKRNPPKSTDDNPCRCFGRPQVCRKCLKKPPQSACRAGTPGFRPPEVLMKYPHQTTAVDVWAAGVIFISLASGRYPFFENSDDMTSLKHITKLLGSKVMKESADAIGKNFLCTPEYPSNDLRTFCWKLRNRSANATPPSTKVKPREGHGNNEPNDNDDDNDATEIMDVNDHFNNNNNANGGDDDDAERTDIIGVDDAEQEVSRSPEIRAEERKETARDASNGNGGQNIIDRLPESTFDLLGRMLDPNPLTRITAAEALRHGYLVD